jgi:hypothetical protein
MIIMAWHECCKDMYSPKINLLVNEESTRSKKEVLNVKKG